MSGEDELEMDAAVSKYSVPVGLGRQGERTEEDNADGDGDACSQAGTIKASRRRAATTPGADSSTAGSKSTKQKDKGKKKCKCCQKLLPHLDFTINSPYCRVCKQGIDNLTHQAQTQKCSDWWRKVRSDEKQLRRAVEMYNQYCPVPTKGGRRGTFQFARAMEEFSASTASRLKEVAPLWHQERWLAHAQTDQCYYGKMTEKAAEAQWEAWKADENHSRDNKGPGGSLRLAVKTDDVIEGENEVRRKKALEVVEKQVKKPDSAFIQEEARRLLKGHDAGATGGDFDPAAMSAMLVAGKDGNVGGNAFAGAGVFVANVSSIQEDMEAEAKAAADAKANKRKGTSEQGGGTPIRAAKGGGTPFKGRTPESGQAEDSDADTDSDADEPERKKPKRWFDPSSINKGLSQAQTVLTTLKAQLQKALDDAAQYVGQHKAMPTSEQEALKGEHQTLEHRHSWIAAVLAEDGKALKALQDNVQTKSAKAPCEKWKELCIFVSVSSRCREAFGRLEEHATCMEEVKAEVEKVKQYRPIFKSIIASSSKACADWKGKLQSIERLKQQQVKLKAKDSKKESSGPKGGGAPRHAAGQTKPIFDAGAAAAQDLPNIAWADAATADLTKPFSSSRPTALADMEARFSKVRVRWLGCLLIAPATAHVWHRPLR
jgi:hypothetical protein